MTHLRALLRWFNWRNGIVIAASVVVAFVGYVLIDATVARNQAVSARQHSESAAAQKIDDLNGRIRHLGDELVRAADQNGARIGELTGQIAALQEQVRQMGGRPVVVSSTSTTTAPSRPSSTTTSSTTTTTTSRQGLCVVRVCIGGN